MTNFTTVKYKLPGLFFGNQKSRTGERNFFGFRSDCLVATGSGTLEKTYCICIAFIYPYPCKNFPIFSRHSITKRVRGGKGMVKEKIENEEQKGKWDGERTDE